MIKLSIPRERQTAFLKAAGYYPHPTIGDDGLTVYGHVLQITERHRWHAIPGDDWVNIHQDVTVNGYHRLNWRKGIEKQERMRLTNLYRTMWPRAEDPTAMKVKGRGEFAPNLQELQRNHRTALPSPEIILLLNAPKEVSCPQMLLDDNQQAGILEVQEVQSLEPQL